jgi:hypothetical protein
MKTNQWQEEWDPDLFAGRESAVRISTLSRFFKKIYRSEVCGWDNGAQYTPQNVVFGIARQQPSRWDKQQRSHRRLYCFPELEDSKNSNPIGKTGVCRIAMKDLSERIWRSTSEFVKCADLYDGFLHHILQLLFNIFFFTSQNSLAEFTFQAGPKLKFCLLPRCL